MKSETPALQGAWLVSAHGIERLWFALTPPVTPIAVFEFSLPRPVDGRVGLFSVVVTSHLKVCANWATVDTGDLAQRAARPKNEQLQAGHFAPPCGRGYLLTWAVRFLAKLRAREFPVSDPLIVDFPRHEFPVAEPPGIRALAGALAMGCLLAAPASARDIEPRFNRLSSDDGLAQNSVESILQDRFGFLWFGTQEGLNRYDGYRFTVYRAGEQPGLGSSEITALAEDTHGDLWVGTSGGLHRLELETGRFHAIAVPSFPRLRIVDVVADAAGRIWFTAESGGLFVVEPGEAMPSVPRRVTTELLPENAPVSRLAPGGEGSVWAARGGALLSVGLENAKTRSAVVLEGLGIVSALAADPAGRVWIGRTSGELLRHDPKDGQTKHFPQAPPNVLVLRPGRDGRLWIGARDGGLSQLDPDSGELVNYRHDPTEPSSLSEDDVAALYEDRFGSLWVGTWNGGVSRLDPYAQAFRTLKHDPRASDSLPDDHVLTMAEAPDGRLWLGSRNGVLAVGDPRTRRFTTVPVGMPPATRLIAIGHHGGDVMVGTTRGLVRLDRETGRRRPLAEGLRASRLHERPISAVCVSSGAFWVASAHTLVRDSAAGVDPYELPLVGQVSALFAPSDDRLLVGSEAGELLMGERRAPTGRFGFRRVGGPEVERSLKAHGFITSVREDTQGGLWVATRNGLGRLAADDDAVEWLDRKDGLPSQAIAGILVDTEGMLWIGTNRGISRVDPRSRAMSHFGSIEGAQGTGYAERACAAGASGLAYFAGRGVTVFDPRDIRLNPSPPEIVFTGLEVLHRRMEPRWRDPDSPLERAIYATEVITLKPDASVFSIEFAALHYGDSDANRYRYRLFGFDPEWIEADAEHRVATYTRLAPGEYVLRVRAGTKTGVWSAREAILTIRTLPPWWRTRLAITAWSVLALAVAIGLWRAMRRHTEVRIALAEREAFRRASFTDPLTGLYNRRFLETFLQHEVARVLRAHESGRSESHGGTDLLFVLIDLDHFKSINDYYSHAVGDRVLKGLADVLTGEIRGSDLAVRWGGDEFLVVSRFVDHRLVTSTVERLRRAAERIDVGTTAGEGPACTVSIGYVLFPFLERQPAALSWERTLEIADRALLVTKKRQRNSYTGLFAGSELSLEALQAFLDGGPGAPAPPGIELVTPEIARRPAEGYPDVKAG